MTMDSPAQRLANAFLLNSRRGQDGFILCANDTQSFMSFFRNGVLTASPVTPAKAVAAVQALLIEGIGLGGHTKTSTRFVLHLGQATLQPYACWIRPSPRGPRLILGLYANGAGERMFDDKPFFEAIELFRKAYAAKDFETALELAALCFERSDIDPFFRVMALESEFFALAGLGRLPPVDEQKLLPHLHAAFGPLSPITVFGVAEHASDHLKEGLRERAQQLWLSVREPYRVIFGDADELATELDAAL
jgi:hypothetical protein